MGGEGEGEEKEKERESFCVVAGKLRLLSHEFSKVKPKEIIIIN